MKFKFPGLIQECIGLIKDLNLPNITKKEVIVEGKISKIKWKNIVKNALMKKCEKEQKEEILKFKKLKDGPMKNERFGTKQYLKNYKLEDARLHFKYRTKMMEFKFNYKNDKKNSSELWNCDSCQSAIETQDHILWCPAYTSLRADKSLDNDEDLIKYFTQVMKIREKLKLKK